ncbi:enoyl-CoA hydratase/isomerase family protein [Lysinibacillus sp. NPDC093190]|uniref:enoyl-CoA hydratase/isomerase family protein n=1 Tax=Lysinibacillus sp. NPDC093190 TaxID=3390575 RepID=UPI003D03C181
MTNEIYVEKNGYIATLVLNRPEKRNSLSKAMFQTILDNLEALRTDSSIKILIIRGVNEVAFSSGADISEFLDIRHATNHAKDYNDLALKAIDALYKFPHPTIAMIQGVAIGGGLELANACDFRLATPKSKLGITAANIGIIYNLESTKRLMNIVGAAKAKEILYTANIFTADEGKNIGLITALYEPEDIENATIQFANHLLSKSSVANAGIKKIIQAIIDGENEESEELAQMILDSFSSDDYNEGIQAFLNKRKPIFNK